MFITEESQVCANGTKYGTSCQNYCDEETLEKRPDEEQIKICMEWLEKNAEKTMIANPGTIGSYGLKHLVEKNMKSYVSNGAFIVACLRSNFICKQETITSPNIIINISKKSVRRAKEEI